MNTGRLLLSKCCLDGIWRAALVADVLDHEFGFGLWCCLFRGIKKERRAEVSARLSMISLGFRLVD